MLEDISIQECFDLISGNDAGPCWRQNAVLVEKLQQLNLLEMDYNNAYEFTLAGERFRDLCMQRIERLLCDSHVDDYYDHALDLHIMKSGLTQLEN